MDPTITVALIAFAGTLCGTFGGIITSSKLTNYRIKQLEAKVDKHNNFAERIPLINQRLDLIDRDIAELKKSSERR